MKRKSFKSLAAILLCVGITTLFSGCGKKDPYTIYMDASKKTSSLPGMEANYSVDMNMDVAGSTIAIKMSSDMRIDGNNTDNMKLDMDMTMDLLGQNITTKTYYTDGYYYMDSMGSKFKYPMNIEELQERLVANNVQTELKEEDFKKLTLTKKDNLYELTFTIDADSMNNMVASSMSSLSDMLGDDSAETTVGNIDGTMTVNKDGYISTMTMKFPCTVSVEGQDVECDMTIAFEYIDPGKDVTVELPDFSEYQEIDMSALE